MKMQVASWVVWKQGLQRGHQASVFSPSPLLISPFTSVSPCFFLSIFTFFSPSLISFQPSPHLSLSPYHYIFHFSLSPVMLSPFSLLHPSLTPFLPTSPPSFCLPFCLSCLSPPFLHSSNSFPSFFLPSLSFIYLSLISPPTHFSITLFLSPLYLSHLWTSS